jgi:hypothetical protein
VSADADVPTGLVEVTGGEGAAGGSGKAAKPVAKKARKRTAKSA